MTDEFDQPDNSARHTITYRILNQDLKDPVRPVEVHATPEEIAQLADQGYLIRERLFQGEALTRLRQALDQVAERERAIKGPGEGLSTSRRFGGLFLRHLMDKDPAFLDLLKFEPTLSVARAMLGPLVQIRGLTARITVPDQPNQETQWHQHHRVISDPLPPWFAKPQALDVLIYLDDLNEANGPLCVLPGSHNRILEDIPNDTYDELPGQQVICLPAGGAILMHGSLLHRAMPNTPQGTIRRLLLLAYTPTWQKQAPYGIRPENGLTEPLRQGDDREARELLGLGGYT